MYSTSIAMDDLDDVRQFLGYDTINLYGGSYGTRAALEYLRRHEAHVRSVVIDGVAPTDLRLPLLFARDAQRSLDLLLAACDKDDACQSTYPNLAGRLRALVARLDGTPVKAHLTHPRTGIASDLTITGRLITGTLFGALYSPLSSSLVPALIDRAERNDFQGMLALALANDGLSENMAIGMQMSVMCAEDGTRITPEQARQEASETLFSLRLVEPRMKACEIWPKAAIESGYYDPPKSNVPTLILSGELDPVTPPAWGELVHKTLPNSKHLVAPGTGHGVIGTACGMRMIADFIYRGTIEGVDDSCLKLLKRPPFFLTPAGPDPARASAPTS
jgi:pimeloyl-ACP methyl ester carboxylesterase